MKSHLDYAVCVWAPSKTSHKDDIGKVQRKAPKMLHGLRHLPYEKRLKTLHLPTLAYRRIKADVIDDIDVYKIVHGLYDHRLNNELRGHKYKWEKNKSHVHK